MDRAVFLQASSQSGTVRRGRQRSTEKEISAGTGGIHKKLLKIIRKYYNIISGYIIAAKIENVMIDDLFVMYQGKKTKIINTAYYNTLVQKKEIFIPTVFHTNHINVSNYERVLNVFESVKKYNYPLNNQYIILYNDKYEIRDGQHRACSLRYLYGNIEIPIKRIYFDEVEVNKFYNK